MKSVGFSPNLVAVRKQRLPPEIAAHKLGVASLTDLLESLHETLVLCFWASVLTTDTMVYMILLSQQMEIIASNFWVFDLLCKFCVYSRLICLIPVGLLIDWFFWNSDCTMAWLTSAVKRLQKSLEDLWQLKCLSSYNLYQLIWQIV